MDNLSAMVLAIVGVMALVIASVVIAVKGKGDKVVSWRGFGVQFEIRPCTSCPTAKTLKKGTHDYQK